MGYLVFLLRWKGSKSERFFPCLLGVDGSVRWIKHRDDSSFDHSHLKSFHLRPVCVRVCGESSGHWVVADVEEAGDPWKAAAAPLFPGEPGIT